MHHPLIASAVRFTTASIDDAAAGLLGYLSCTINGRLRIDGITLRRTAHGRLTLSFPERRDGQGRMHPLIHPLDDQSRRDLERQILEAINQEMDR